MIEMADGMVQIHTGDAREVLRSLPAESVQCVVTSPPYWSLRDYGVPPSIWGGMPSCSHAWGPHGTLHKGGSQGATGVRADRDATQIELTGDLDVGCFCQECGAWFGCLGLEPTPMMFVDHIVEVFAEVHRVLKPDGCLFFNMGDVFATGAYSAKIVGGGEQGARWMGDIGRHRDTYRRNPTANRSRG